MNVNLISFAHDQNGLTPADMGEKIGNICYGLLRIGFGREVEVRWEKGQSASPEMKASSYSILQRIGAIALAILIFPVTAVLAAAGAIAFRYSESRKEYEAFYNNYVNSVSDLCRLDLSKEKNIDVLTAKVPGYALDDKTLDDVITLERVEAAKGELEKALANQRESIDTQELRGKKTAYLKLRDMHKVEKHKSAGMPNPSPEIPLLPADQFFEELKKCLPDEVEEKDLVPHTEPVLKFPNGVYQYDHPRDSDEGLNPMFQAFGVKKGAKNNWSQALEYAKHELLPNPLKDMDSEQLFHMIKTLHHKIVGKEEELRDQFSLVCDPKKCEISFPAFHAYLKEQDGGVWNKRLHRLEEKFKRWKTIETAAPYITPKQWDALKKVVFIPSSPFGLEEKVKNFLYEMTLLMKEGKHHPLQIASFLHHGLTTLHLYQDANGRLARLVTNIYLMQNGYEPFYVVSDADYTDLFQEKQYDLAFSKYLLANWRLMEKVEKLEVQQSEMDNGVQCVTQ